MCAKLRKNEGNAKGKLVFIFISEVQGLETCFAWLVQELRRKSELRKVEHKTKKLVYFFISLLGRHTSHPKIEKQHILQVSSSFYYEKVWFFFGKRLFLQMKVRKCVSKKTPRR